MASSSLSSSSKKKQDEKNLKMLREIAAAPSNKQCFDCLQRGPTYVNTTVGSFVCISCSGKLRGLTPPHRVKSISMANFTTEELEFLRSRGNEFCQKVWLGFYEMSNFASDTKEEQKFRDFLAAKYEAKRWYKDPSTVLREAPSFNGFSPQKPTQSAPSASSVSNKTTTTSVSRPVAQSSLPATSRPSNVLAEVDFFSQPAAPLTQPAFPAASKVPQQSETFFADFQNAFAASSNTSPGTKMESRPVKIAGNAQNGTSPKVPSEDRYSALKDLDAIFSGQSPGKQPAESPWGAPTKNSAWGNGFSSSPTKNETAPTVVHQTAVRHFGFPAIPEVPAAQGVWGSPSSSTMHKNGFSSSNPFLNGNPPQQYVAQQPFGPASAAQGFSPWSSPPRAVQAGFYGQTTTLTSSQSVTFPIKAWPTPAAQNPSNPFLDGAAMGAGAGLPKTRSYNPFL